MRTDGQALQKKNKISFPPACIFPSLHFPQLTFIEQYFPACIVSGNLFQRPSLPIFAPPTPVAALMRDLQEVALARGAATSASAATCPESSHTRSEVCALRCNRSAPACWRGRCAVRGGHT